MAVEIPKITEKYITTFKRESDYEAAYPTFEEVNWSNVAPVSSAPDSYRTSRRLSNMYHKNNPPDYKFDNINDSVTEGEKVYTPDAAKVFNYNENDDIRKTFFLEIVWGYSGWEWHDYERVIGTDPETGEPITETLKGGNLYKIKDIQTVPHIIDGHRLQHINDFLFSQYNVTRVEGFNTENLVAANRAFKRGTNKDTNYPKRHLNQAVECHFVDGYNTDGTFANHPIGYADPVTGESLLENLVEADGLFYNNRVYMYEGDFNNVIPFTIPNITSIDRLYAYGFYTERLKFKFDKLEKLTNAFMGACFYNSVLNLNEVFVGDTLKKITDFNHMLYLTSLVGYSEDPNLTMHVSLDLTDSTVDSDTVIDLSSFIEFAGTREQGTSYSPVTNSVIDIDLNFNNKVNLNSAFRYLIGNKPSNWRMGDDQRTYHLTGSFAKMALNLNNKENYITTIKYGLANNTFIEAIPVTQVPNNDCNDSYIYQGSTFNVPVSYDFHNGTLASPRTQGYGQFNSCTFNDTFDFDPDHTNNKTLEYLDRVEFCGIKFGDNVAAADRAFPYIVQNQNDTTYRYFEIRNSKFVGTLPTQNIYIDTARVKLTPDKYEVNNRNNGEFNPFYGCSELTDLSNIHLYYSDIDARQGYPDGITSGTNFSMDFSGCTNMTKSPYIHLLFYRIGYMYFPISFAKLKNLTEVNFENFSLGCTSAVTGISFQDCTNLVTLKFANNMADGWSGIVDLRGCTSLDINALKAALVKDSVTNMGGLRNGKVYFLESTWRAVNDMSPSSTEPISGPVKTYFDSNGINYNYTPDATYHEGDPRPN